MEKQNCKIFDVFLFFNELDLLEIRLKTLNKVVDYFVITECDTTFSGKSKPMLFAKNLDRFKEYLDKIIYNPITQYDLRELKDSQLKEFITDFNLRIKYKHNGKSPQNLNKSVKREINHRDAGILGLHKYAKDDDIIVSSDVDEIPDPKVILSLKKNELLKPHYLEMKWYLYWINNIVLEPWYGTVCFKFKLLKGSSLDNLRFAKSNNKDIPGEIIKNGGWHFSYLGGEKSIQKKLKALAYQGRRAQLSMFLHKIGFRKIDNILSKNKDLLLQKRKFKLVKIDEDYPESIKKDDFFVNKYSKL